MAVGGALQAAMPGHMAVVDDGYRAGGVDGGDDAAVQAVQIFAVAFQHRQAVAGQRAGGGGAFQVVRGVAGDGDVVVVDDQFDIEVLRQGQAGGFGVVPSCCEPSEPRQNTVLPGSRWRRRSRKSTCGPGGRS